MTRKERRRAILRDCRVSARFWRQWKPYSGSVLMDVVGVAMSLFRKGGSESAAEQLALLQILYQLEKAGSGR